MKTSIPQVERTIAILNKTIQDQEDKKRKLWSEKDKALKQIQLQEQKIAKPFDDQLEQAKRLIHRLTDNITKLERQAEALKNDEALQGEVSLDWFKAFAKKHGVMTSFDSYYDYIGEKKAIGDLRIFALVDFSKARYFAFKGKKLVAYQHTTKARHRGDYATYGAYYGGVKDYTSDNFRVWYENLKSKTNLKAMQFDQIKGLW